MNADSSRKGPRSTCNALFAKLVIGLASAAVVAWVITASGTEGLLGGVWQVLFVFVCGAAWATGSHIRRLDANLRYWQEVAAAHEREARDLRERLI